MRMRPVLTLTALVMVAASASGQRRTAAMTGGGSADRGKCTIEVVVDGVVEIEIRGNSANLRNLSGRPPEWRRFQCTGVMPANPAGFRFSGVDGRGSQELVRDPRNGGVAVVRIEDKDGGAEGYTFDIEWSGGFGGGRNNDGYPGDRDDNRRGQPPDRMVDRQFSMDQAVRACQDAVRQQALERFRARDIVFRRTAVEDNPGPRDRVSGVLEIRRRGDRDESHRFVCSVDFGNRRIRTAEIEPADSYGRDGDRGDFGGREREVMESCRRAVEQRLRRDGFDRIDFRDMNFDSRGGRRDSIIGNARADRRGREESFDFACSLNPGDQSVRSVNVTRSR